MLKKLRKIGTALALTTALGGGGLLVAPAAHAVNLADDGIGEVLIGEYYTIRNGWATLFTIINTSDNVVAAKVRFREAYNSRDVLDFVIVLSPYDVWTAFTATNAAGDPVLRTNDNTCTSPLFVPVPGLLNPNTKELPFSNFAYSGAFVDGGPSTLDRAREGWWEVIAIGTGKSIQGAVTAAAIHNPQTGIPGNCGLVAQAFNPAAGANALLSTSLEFFEPTNVLQGNSYQVRVSSGQGAGKQMTTLANCYNPSNPLLPFIPPAVDGQSGFIPPFVEPLLPNHPDPIPAAVPLLGLVLPPLPFPIPPGVPLGVVPDDLIVALANFDNPPDSGPNLNFCYPHISHVRDDTPSNFLGQFLGLGGGPSIFEDQWNRGVDAVSAVLTRTDVTNEWAGRDDPAGAFNNQSEWAVTFPTKNWYVDDTKPGIPPAINPFSEVFAGESCVDAHAMIWDREERTVNNLSPLPPPLEVPLCYEANIITFRAEVLGEVLGSEVDINIPTTDLPVPIQQAGQYLGWMDLDLTGWGGNLEAVAGLGSDVRANQIYDDGDPIETGLLPIGVPGDYVPGNADPGCQVPPLVPQAGIVCPNALASSCGYVYPPGFGPDNPPGGFGPPPPALCPPGPNALLCNTLVLTGMNLQPLMVFGGFFQPQLQTATCDTDPSDAIDDRQPAIFGPPPTLVRYQGLPVVGFKLNVRTLTGNPALSYSSIVAHGYKRSIVFDPLVLNGPNNLNATTEASSELLGPEELLQPACYDPDIPGWRYQTYGYFGPGQSALVCGANGSLMMQP